MFVIGSQSSIVATLIGGITMEMEERRDPVDNIPLRFRLNMNLQPEATAALGSDKKVDKWNGSQECYQVLKGWV